MTGGYTQVPLRREDRWTGARMQQGRVLLDHDWNLNLDASGRANQEVARDAIGWAGVVAGSSAFEIGIASGGTLDLTVGAGRMWVDGLEAFAPAPFSYLSQELIAPLPATGTVLAYLDVWEEHVQPAEDPADLVDPALGTIDTTCRTRAGYRVRVAPTTATTCAAAWAGLTTAPESTGAMTVARAAAPPAPDPCAPPGDPLAQVADGLLRVEVIDAGSETTARFAWSYEDGSNAVQIVGVAGNTIQLSPSNLQFGVGDLIEVSWLVRRADRVDHGALYTVQTVTPGAGGDSLVLDRAVTAPAGASGLCARRWDGQAVGAAAATTALWHALDLGIEFTAGAGAYQPGDWWGARLRSESGDGIEHLTAAVPDGILHAFAPLALVDLGAKTVLSDCRPTFVSLVDLDCDRGACTVSVKPGDDLQAALDSLPAGGGELCLAAGVYLLPKPLTATKRERIVINGSGPASIVRAERREAAIVFDSCQEVEVRDVRVEGGTPGGAAGDPNLEGAITFLSCRDVVVQDCVLACPDQAGRIQTCVTVRPGAQGPAPDGIRIERNRFQVGAWQTGVLVVDSAATVIADNRIQLGPASGGDVVITTNPTLAKELARVLRAGLREKGGTGIAKVTPPGAETAINVRKGSEAEVIARDFVNVTTAAKIKRAGGVEKALLAHVRALGQGKQVEAASPELKQVIAGLLLKIRAVGQGIVIAGSSVGTARIDGNLVEDTVQGIHVGISDAEQKARDAADTVVVSRNVVHALVPVDYSRDRHGVFVGNARSIHVVDTVATLRRIGTVASGAKPTEVEGIRIYGVLGPFLTVRQSSLQGFAVGVRVVPLAPFPKPRMWLVAETFAADAAPVLDAPTGLVVSERNPM
ncbi:MAG TPA: hypothetical protein VIM23_04780 [Gaiellaceae bacterium]|jgi:hypothetical protein